MRLESIEAVESLFEARDASKSEFGRIWSEFTSIGDGQTTIVGSTTAKADELRSIYEIRISHLSRISYTVRVAENPFILFPVGEEVVVAQIEKGKCRGVLFLDTGLSRIFEFFFYKAPECSGA